jgi:hypothetical protein
MAPSYIKVSIAINKALFMTFSAGILKNIIDITIKKIRLNRVWLTIVNSSLEIYVSTKIIATQAQKGFHLILWLLNR